MLIWDRHKGQYREVHDYGHKLLGPDDTPKQCGNSMHYFHWDNATPDDVEPPDGTICACGACEYTDGVPKPFKDAFGV